MPVYDYETEQEGFLFYGSYELEPYEPATEESPGYLPFVTVLSCYIKGLPRDVMMVIDPGIIHQIEKQLVMEHVP